MNEFSMDLLDKLSKAAIISSPTRPRLLLESDEVRAIRDRARAIPGFVDGVAGKARDAVEGDPFFHPKVEDSYLYRPFLNMLMPLLTATLVLDDERSAARVLPEEIECWRMSDVERTSIYTDSNSLEMVRPRIRYRGFGPVHPGEAMDALWAVHVGDPEDRPRIGTSVDDKHLNVSITFTDGSRREVEIARTP